VSIDILPLFRPLHQAIAYRGAYDWSLVTISVFVAILAAFVALSIANRIAAASTSRARLIWASAGAISMGGGIWAMHFVGMLAFSLPCGVTYDPLQTLLSMIPGMLASGVALSVISRAKAGPRRLAVGALLMGAGIGTMHYWGMAAMEVDALRRYDPTIVGVSVLAAVALAYVSLITRAKLATTRLKGLPNQLLAAAIMGCAVAAMHFIAMQASIFYPLAGIVPGQGGLPQTALALTVGGIGALTAVSALAAAFAGEQREVANRLAAELAERKLLEADLILARELAEDANHAKSQFLATMSHEIRTPLNGVLGMAQAMARDPLSDPQKERLQVIQASGATLLAVLNDLLDLSKIEAGKLELERAPFDIEAVAAGAYSTFTSMANAGGVSFSMEIAPRARGRWLGDAVRVRQILYNLISNALKFTREGSVRVGIDAADDGALLISVADTGVGIAPENLPKVFEKFVQADSSTTRRFGGTGLGLAICKEIAAMMGGTIGVESRLGEGTTFRVSLSLPRAEAAGEPAAQPHLPEAEVSAGAGLEGMRILAAEDNATNQIVLKALMQPLGLAPLIVENGELAVEAWAHERFDLILMDIQMPTMDGLAATREIRRREAETSAARTPIVALSANAMKHQIAEYLAAGMDAHLSKPIEAERLFSILLAFRPGQAEGEAGRAQTG
jgi:signal transduction histidine kinase